jgi:hypothetical protein
MIPTSGWPDHHHMHVTGRRRLSIYGVITRVGAPVEIYDGMHAEMTRRTGTTLEGLLVHVGRPTADGFEVLEVWESKEHYDRANTTIVFPLMEELARDQSAPQIEQETEVFTVHGLVIPRGEILF